MVQPIFGIGHSMGANQLYVCPLSFALTSPLVPGWLSEFLIERLLNLSVETWGNCYRGAFHLFEFRLDNELLSSKSLQALRHHNREMH
jgi:hypothetical protein